MALLLNRLYAPLTALATARLDVVTAIVSFERVFEVLDLEPLIQEPAEPTAVPDGPVSVELNGVRFAYPSADKVSLASLEEVAVLDERAGDEVLHGVSFGWRPGQTVALVGSSGAGKSTIASLVPRLYDPDARHGVAVGRRRPRRCPSTTSGATVGVVTQDGHLFHETIRENLVFAAPGATDDDLWVALAQRPARRARAPRSPRGSTRWWASAATASPGGERQRLTIARLLLAGPRVVILDEATAHLDSESEVAVQEALAAALAGRTAIVIAHRLSTIKAADQILVVDHGSGGRARHPFHAARRGWPLRRPVPHPVRRRRPARRRTRRAPHRVTPCVEAGERPDPGQLRFACHSACCRPSSVVGGPPKTTSCWRPRQFPVAPRLPRMLSRPSWIRLSSV